MQDGSNFGIGSAKRPGSGQVGRGLVAATLMVAGLLSGCDYVNHGANALTGMGGCADKQTTSLMLQLYRDQLVGITSDEPKVQAYIDQAIKQGFVAVDQSSVRTVKREAGSTAAVCLAEVAFHGAKEPQAGSQRLLSMDLMRREGDTIKIPVPYRAQLTDDGSKVYVHLEPESRNGFALAALLAVSTVYRDNAPPDQAVNATPAATQGGQPKSN